MERLKKATRYTACFDESFNRISNRKQLDEHIIYFDEDEMIVRRQYIGSVFMGHVDAESGLDAVLELLNELN